MIDRIHQMSPHAHLRSQWAPSYSSARQFATTVTCFLIVVSFYHNFNVVARPSHPSNGAHNNHAHHNRQLSDQEFCTLENFQNCLNVDLFQSLKSADQNKNSNKHPSKSHIDSSETKTLKSDASSSSTDLAFPTTIEELSRTCHDLKERVKCLDEHSERCFSPQMMQIFGHIVTNAKQFVYDLCDNRHIQSQFLVHAKCFRNISLDDQKCGLEYKDSLAIPGESSALVSGQPRYEAFKDPALPQWLPNPAKLVQLGRDTVRDAQDAQQKEQFMRRSCCALQELVMCKRRHVREQCGESASIFMRDHLPRITNPVLEQHCSAFTYGPGTCDEALHRRRMIDGQLVQVQPVMFQQQNRDLHAASSSLDLASQLENSSTARIVTSGSSTLLLLVPTLFYILRIFT